MKIFFGIILILSALALVFLVLMQSGKDKSLSSALAGGSDTYYGKNKSKGMDKKLNTITAIVAVVFVVIVLLSFIIQDDADLKDIKDLTNNTSDEVTTVIDGTTTVSDDTTVSDGDVTTSADETND